MAHDSSPYRQLLSIQLSKIPERPQHILDVCTGTGLIAMIASQVFPEALVEGVDQSPKMIEIAKRRVAESGLTNIRHTIGDARDLPFDEHTFDLVLSSNAPIHLLEMRRVLGNGGYLLLSFSFSGRMLYDHKKDIERLLENNGLQLFENEVFDDCIFVCAHVRDAQRCNCN